MQAANNFMWEEEGWRGEEAVEEGEESSQGHNASLASSGLFHLLTWRVKGWACVLVVVR